MLFLFLFFLCAQAQQGEDSEFCVNEKAIIHHTFEDLDIAGGLDTDVDPLQLENEGTWAGEYFECYYPKYNSEIDQYYCDSGTSHHKNTCDPKMLKTSEVWLKFFENENIDFPKDWMIQSLNILVFGVDGSIEVTNASDTSPSITFVVLETFDDVYEEAGHLTHITIVFDDYNVDVCSITLKVYINATLVLELEDIEVDYYYGIDIRTMLRVHVPLFNPPEEVYFVGAWDHALDAEQIAELYALGLNRPANTTLTKCTTHENVVSLTGFDAISSSISWGVVGFFVLLGVFVFFFIGVGILAYNFYSKNRNVYRKLINEK